MIFLKKITALILSFVLILSCSVSVFAAETNKEKTGVVTKKIEIGTGTSDSYRTIVQKYPAAAEFIYNELKNNYKNYLGGNYINVRNYNIPIADGFALYYGVVNEYMDLYHVNLTTCTRNVLDNDSFINGLKPTFLFDTAEKIETANKAVEKQITKYLKGVDNSWPDIQKARYLHDLLALQTEYVDTDQDIQHSAYGILVNKEGVCQGYTHAYGILLDRCGIDSTIATSPAPYMKHEWNQVVLNGNFYNVDVTWDDPVMDDISTEGVKEQLDSLGYVSHQYFLSSDTLFASEGNNGHHDWIGEDATDTTYDNAWWKDIETFIYYNGDNNKEYYIKKVRIAPDDENNPFYKGVFTKRDSSTGEERTIQEINERWSAGGGYSWIANYSMLSFYDGYFYFNSPVAIFKMKPEDTNSQLVYQKKDDEYEIYGIRIKPDGRLDYAVMEDPRYREYRYTYDLKSAVERALSEELAIDSEDTYFGGFGITVPDDGYTGLNFLGVQKKSADEQNSMRFISLVSSEVLKNAKEYGYVFTSTSKETATAKQLASKLTVENGHKYDCKDTVNTSTGNWGNGDLDATGYKYVTAAINNITGNKAIVARLYFIDKDDNVHYGSYIDSDNNIWDGCAARLSDLV